MRSLKGKPTPATPATASESSETPTKASDEQEESVDEKGGPTLHNGEPEFEPSGGEDDLDEDYPEFPTTHELILKDYTKVSHIRDAQ